jgi:hypothetical protein
MKNKMHQPKQPRGKLKKVARKQGGWTCDEKQEHEHAQDAETDDFCELTNYLNDHCCSQ